MKRNGYTPPRLLVQHMGSDLAPVIAGGIIAALILSFTLVIVYFHQRGRENVERLSALSTLSLTRAKLEGALVSRLLLVKGLVSYISLHNDISKPLFDAYAEKLVGNDSVIKNVTLIRNTTIIYAYPLAGNEKAIGVDLSRIPGQAETVRTAIETKETVISGPVPLIQGGVGIISRIPVFQSNGAYWGQASTVIMQDLFMAEVGLRETTGGLRFALRGVDGTGPRGAVFWGDPAVFSADPVTLEVSFPNGSWQIAASPVRGWGGLDTFTTLFMAAGLLFSLLAGFLLWSLVRARHALRDMAFHDPLTGLPNRMLFADRFSVALPLSKRQGAMIAIMMLDLNRFKQVNDELGHATGDILLTRIAQRLTGSLRQSDTVVRYGGDEFIIMFPDLTDRGAVRDLEVKVARLFDEPFACAGRDIRIGTSIGTALFPDDGDTMEALLQKADTLMYGMKRR